MNKNVTFLFIIKNISCVQFSSCHISDEIFLMSNFSQTTVVIYLLIVYELLRYFKRYSHDSGLLNPTEPLPVFHLTGHLTCNISKVRNVLRKQTQIYKLTDIFRILQTSSL